MNLRSYEPFSILNQMQKALSSGLPFERGTSLLDDQTEGNYALPAVDIKEEKDKFVLLADLPGVDAKDIDISMDGNILTIKGERKSEKQENKDGYTRIERTEGIFMRRFTLPATVDANAIAAKTNKGVLELTIPKIQKSTVKKINVEDHEKK